ncbi:unnamed protein product, partial [Mesorhabditis belari]|uniref:G-protein coupled receptors family 1 profile domain-containing protein n=1 Tax=Mesorhabditis belari TaxID=2138241 RepID=A0AAF3EUX2_9BILA
MTTTAQICEIIKKGTNLSIESAKLSANNDDLDAVNLITYVYICPIIICFGIIGDLLTIATLTHPTLRRGSIIFIYLTLLAITDLLTQLSVIPMIFLMIGIQTCSFTTAFFYAHLAYPLVNSLMGASVWIVVFLTLSQYMAVCHPFSYKLRSRKTAIILFTLSYFLNFAINAPWAVKKSVHELELPSSAIICKYQTCDTELKYESWFTSYEWGREILGRVAPFFILAYFNIRILIAYRKMKADRNKMTTSHKETATEKSEKEERRIFVLLITIIIIFFICTMPAAPLTVLVGDKYADNLALQIFRSVGNVLEITKFALNFYFYCLVNGEIRKRCARMFLCVTRGNSNTTKSQASTQMSQMSSSGK